jgi:hypothetical protein
MDGALTLNIDSLGAIPVKKADGSSDPAASELASGQYYDLTYDGTVFRLPQGESSFTCAKHTVAYSDVNAAANTNSFTLKTLAENEAITGLRIKHSAPFAGGATTSVTVSIGKTGDMTAYSPAFNVFQAASSTAQLYDSGLYSADAAAHDVTAYFTSSHPLNTLTSGSVDFHICTVRLQ